MRTVNGSPTPAGGPAAGSHGLGVALATPFVADGAVDIPLLIDHARALIDRGVSTLTLFGTTGEGSSIGAGEREATLSAFAASGIDLRQRLIGTVFASAVEDAAAQARRFLEADARAVLLAPPFYFKGVGEEGVFRWFADVIEEIGAGARDLLIYDIPQLTSVLLGSAVIGRLRLAFTDVVTGVKYSANDPAHVRGLLAIEPKLAVLIGDETLLAGTVRKGGAGAVSGLANIVPELLLPVATRGDDDPRIVSLVEAILDHPVIPAIKSVLAHATGDLRWRSVRPPLSTLASEQAERLGFAWDRAMAR